MANIRDFIIKYIKKHGKVKVSNIAEAMGFSRTYVNRYFKELRDEKQITALGQTNRAYYILTSEFDKRRFIGKLPWIRSYVNKNLAEDKVFGDMKLELSFINKLADNVYKILEYAFTEIFNNAIEHSNTDKIFVKFDKRDNDLVILIRDKGIGIYNNLIAKYKLGNNLEAIETLLKGKQTTKPSIHSGEGIFFSSKAVDRFIIKSSNKKLIIDNQIEDVFIRDIKSLRGTMVNLLINTGSKRDLAKIFNQYSDVNHGFTKTTIKIKLYQGGASYVSRSQARRVMFGLDKFKIISLDFDKLDTVGQGFVDEIFRVWQNKYPNIKINYINVNDNVEFMIKRTLAETL